LLADTALSWTLGPDGEWTRLNPNGDVDSQAVLLKMAQQRARVMDSPWEL
jgi:hypothetical protein